MKLDGFDLESLFRLVLSDPEYISSLTYEDASVLDSFIMNIITDLRENNNYQEFVNKYGLELGLKDGEDITQGVSNKLNNISDIIVRKCEATYKLYGLEELELEEIPFMTEGSGLNQQQLGLLYFYISVNGGKFIQPDWYLVANKNGYSSKNSGNKIYQIFCKQHKKVNRTNYPTAALNIKKVISYLTGYPKSKILAENDLLVAEELIRKTDKYLQNKRDQ
jgi:hypothetical protein